VTKTYAKGKHEMKFFQEETFVFLYYLQHNELPSSAIIKAMKKKKMKSKFVSVNGKKYFLNKYGTRVTGWRKIKKKHYYFSKKTAVMKTGWLTLKGKKYYLSYRGRRYHGWHTIDGKVYYFNKKTGVMQKNKKIGQYYVGSDGSRQ
jgi:glucan-binding YG repeat protein